MNGFHRRPNDRINYGYDNINFDLVSWGDMTSFIQYHNGIHDKHFEITVN